jgi:hypothetical protein
MAMKVERNGPCPCGSGQKFKKCCYGRVPWEDLFREGSPEVAEHLTIRGKNLAFLGVIGDALQLDNLDKEESWGAVKRACTPSAIRKIHEAIPGLWPTEDDLQRVLEAERDHVSGLYVGTYELGTIFRNLTRHSIYSDRLLLFDPFTDPRTMRPEYNPVEHPEIFRMTTLQWVRLWLALAPWIDAGLVQFVRRPDDINGGLLHEAMKAQKRKFDSNPEFARIIKDTMSLVEGERAEAQDMKELIAISKSDPEIVASYVAMNPKADQFEIDRFMAAIARRREEHPYYVHGATPRDTGQGELLMTSTGSNFYIAKLVAASAGAHLITDLPSRWKEVEIDREAEGAGLGSWTPFAKAFQAAPLKVLGNVPLSAALTLRKEERLDDMRRFLKRVWKASRANDEMSDANGEALKDELIERIREADHEWRKIDQELVKWFTVQSGAAVAALPRVGTGGASWLAGGWMLGAVGAFGNAWYQRARFHRRYPAAFFLTLKAD